MTCRWNGSDSPRLLRTHLPRCESSACAGCEPCPERHCGICGREHVTVEGRGSDQTCATCISEIRDNLDKVAELSPLMPVAAVESGRIDSAAAILAGPVADPEVHQRRHRLVTNAAVNADERSAAVKAWLAWVEDNRDEPHPAWTVGTWEMLIREHLDQPSDEPIQTDAAVTYIANHLTRDGRIAHDPEFPIDELARDLRQCVGRLEDALATRPHEERGAPCPACGRKELVKHYGKRVEDDRWTCPACSQWWCEKDYRNKVEGIYLQAADRLTASQIAATYRIPEATVRKWAQRDQVRTYGYDGQRRMLYDVADTLAMRDGTRRQAS